ncbi:CDP-alcohol phosphatidyltransferase family protein, partial [Micromonospora sp. NPDC000207]|uniref:CDP-alcohol phosphatidyltransferase family protein n=1 Tax=Micromonospora sp. NPDC000207 TaxID=3154246 RepID=UPI00331DBA69
MPTVRTGPVVGLIAQVLLLAGLASTVGLSAAGWAAGVGYGVVLCLTLSNGLRRSAADRLGPADRVTLSRAILVGGVTALVVDPAPAPVALLVGLAGVALAMDAVDGQVARRTGTSSALGARFDMEVDAFLILVLSVYLVPPVGGWVLAIGLMRYVFVAASWVLPWMRGSLPPRRWRKVVAAVQGVALAVAAAQVLPAVASVGVVVVALALLVESFGRDVTWLWRHRPADVATVPVATGGAPVAVRPGRPGSASTTGHGTAIATPVVGHGTAIASPVVVRPASATPVG